MIKHLESGITMEPKIVKRGSELVVGMAGGFKQGAHKEIGALCVTVWLVFYLVAHRFFKSSARGILTISMLGNIVVSLAWFGPQLNGLHQYGTFSQPILLIAVVANVVFFTIGYCPAGWLRTKRA